MLASRMDFVRSLPVRFSRLKNMGQSPKHYEEACFEDDDSFNTPSTLIGSAVHSFSFGGKPVTCFSARKQGKDWESFQEEHDGSIILTKSEFERAAAMWNAIRSNDLAMDALSDVTHREQLIRWKIGDRECQSTIDARSPRALLELKTTVCANPRRFISDALRRVYHSQCSFYRTALDSIGEVVPPSTKIIAVENKKPFSVIVFSLTPRTLDAGEKIWRSWFEQLMVCEQSGVFPGYAQGEVEFDIDDDADGSFSVEIDGEEVEI